MKSFIPFLFLLLPFSGISQFFEVGVSVGGANYIGELASNSSTIILKETNLAAGAFARYNFNHLFGIRLHGQYAKVSGADGNSANRAVLDRNLSFRSTITEVGLIGEFNILGFDPYAGSFSPYLFGGIAFYSFNPQAAIDGQHYDLQPLGTEGQGLEQYPDRSPYELNQLAIPIGIGLKFALFENLHLGLEFGARKLFTDYLDDVSLTYPDISFFDTSDPIGAIGASLSDRSLSPEPKTELSRGDAKANDWYGMANFTISYNFLDTGTIRGRRGNRRSKVGCPTF